MLASALTLSKNRPMAIRSTGSKIVHNHKMSYVAPMNKYSTILKDKMTPGYHPKYQLLKDCESDLSVAKIYRTTTLCVSGGCFLATGFVAAAGAALSTLMFFSTGWFFLSIVDDIDDFTRETEFRTHIIYGDLTREIEKKSISDKS